MKDKFAIISPVDILPVKNRELSYYMAFIQSVKIPEDLLFMRQHIKENKKISYFMHLNTEFDSIARLSFGDYKKPTSKYLVMTGDHVLPTDDLSAFFEVMGEMLPDRVQVIFNS